MGKIINKIFCIGLSKTGTTSLTDALNILGYEAFHFPSIRYFPHKLIRIKNEYLIEYDALTDISVIPFYKKLDEQYPGSKFIYTYREKNNWLKSCSKYPRYHLPWYHLPFKIIKLRQQIYSAIKFDEEKFSAAYDRHEKDVMNYFKHRKNDLLILNIREEDTWEKLCAFLDKPIPNRKFPFKNSRKNNYDNLLYKVQNIING